MKTPTEITGSKIKDFSGSGQTTFTIFIPTYNRAHTLPRAMDSIQDQTCRDFEGVIVDDGSTDGTKELVEDGQWTACSSSPTLKRMVTLSEVRGA